MSGYCVDDNTEVKIMESVDYGDTNLNHIIEGDRYSDREDERFTSGFSKKEFGRRRNGRCGRG